MFVDDAYAIYGFADLAMTQLFSISPNTCLRILLEDACPLK